MGITGSTLARDPVRNAEEGRPLGVAEREHGAVGVVAVTDAYRVVVEDTPTHSLPLGLLYEDLCHWVKVVVSGWCLLLSWIVMCFDRALSIWCYNDAVRSSRFRRACSEPLAAAFC